MPTGLAAVHALDWTFGPEHALAAWPQDRLLIALWSARGQSADHAARSYRRWSVFAEPVGMLRISREAESVHRSSWLPAAGHDQVPALPDSLQDQPLEDLDRALAATRLAHPPTAEGAPDLPFLGGWIGWLSYELGRIIEPAAACRGTGGPTGALPPLHDDRAWPLAQWHRCPAALLHDGQAGRWWAVGDPRWIERLPELTGWPAPPPAGFTLGPLASRSGQALYEASIARTVRYIRDGDIFQANIAHRLSGAFGGSSRALFGALAAAAAPSHGAYIESPIDARQRPAGEARGSPRRVIASVSPELFFEVDRLGRPAARIVTRPIKGTRRGDADPAELARSAKDQAELNMIVDLMRNDIGRVCRIGSVRVDDPRVIERHGAGGGAGPGVLHGVATVSGQLRDDVTFGQLLAATFPPGSVTGAPKIRAMQIIEKLEPVCRGPYCGSIGYVSDCGKAALSVAIRTAAITGAADPISTRPDAVTEGVLDYSVGAGIVAESDPAAEWAETLDKAAPILQLAAPAPNPSARAGRTSLSARTPA